MMKLLKRDFLKNIEAIKGLPQQQITTSGKIKRCFSNPILYRTTPNEEILLKSKTSLKKTIET